MKEIVNHFNNKKLDFSNFFTQIANIIQQLNFSIQLQIDKQYDSIIKQFQSAPSESVQQVCKEMESKRGTFFQNIIQILHSQLMQYVKQQIRTNSYSQKHQYTDSNAYTKINNFYTKNSDESLKGLNGRDKNYKNLSSSPPKIVFTSQPTQSIKFDYKNQIDYPSQKVKNFGQFQSVQETKYELSASHFNQNNRQIPKSRQTTYFSGNTNKNQKSSQFSSYNNWRNQNECEKEQKAKRKISITKNHEICQNLDKLILSEANQLLQKSQSRKRINSLKKSNASLRKSPQKQQKFNKGIDKILQCRIGQNFVMSSSKKNMFGLQQSPSSYTSPIKKYNI